MTVTIGRRELLAALGRATACRSRCGRSRRASDFWARARLQRGAVSRHILAGPRLAPDVGKAEEGERGQQSLSMLFKKRGCTPLFASRLGCVPARRHIDFRLSPRNTGATWLAALANLRWSKPAPRPLSNPMNTDTSTHQL